MQYFSAVPKPARRGSAPSTDGIHLRTQFFLPADGVRRSEIQEALRRNVANPYLTTITLLNEQLYTWSELGCAPTEKVQQKVINRRAKFSDLFLEPDQGFTVVANADIFFDDTIARLRALDLHERRAAMALLRFEFRGETDLGTCRIFGPRPDSMDTWIVHSSQPLPAALLQFDLGRPGCDNKLIYLLDLLGFALYNDPLNVRTYHHHAGAERDYSKVKDKLPAPYMLLPPARLPLALKGGITAADVETYELQAGNARLFDFLASRGEAPFVVPRVAGIENNAAISISLGNVELREPLLKALKNNAGLQFDSSQELKDFSNMYLAPFEQSELYASWEPWAVYTDHIRQSQPYVQKRFQKPQFSAHVFDVFHFVAGGRPWTHALANKRLLIVSPFVDQMQKQPAAYPIDLFPGCTFVYLKPPMTQAEEPNRGWTTEFADLCESVKGLEFDVALCSCGGYGNPLVGYIHSLGKSAIYVGGVLQLYFGIYGQRWLAERADALRLYMNSTWVRPDARPAGYKGVEKGCYW